MAPEGEKRLFNVLALWCRFNRICDHLTHRNPAEVFPALGSQRASERFVKVKIKRCSCWGYHRTYFWTYILNVGSMALDFHKTGVILQVITPSLQIPIHSTPWTRWAHLPVSNTTDLVKNTSLSVLLTVWNGIWMHSIWYLHVPSQFLDLAKSFNETYLLLCCTWSQDKTRMHPNRPKSVKGPNPTESICIHQHPMFEGLPTVPSWTCGPPGPGRPLFGRTRSPLVAHKNAQVTQGLTWLK